MKPDITITVQPATLSDNSKVFNVAICGRYSSVITVPAYSEEDAYELAEKIEGAINEHTVAVAELREDAAV